MSFVKISIWLLFVFNPFEILGDEELAAAVFLALKERNLSRYDRLMQEVYYERNKVALLTHGFIVLEDKEERNANYQRYLV